MKDPQKSLRKLLVAVLIAALLLPGALFAAETIKIGVLFPLTGGAASAATSTRSMSRCFARSSAWAMGRIPSCSPSALTTRTSRTRMPSLTRMSLGCIAVTPYCAGLRPIAPR